jgi:hypothetical protein
VSGKRERGQEGDKGKIPMSSRLSPSATEKVCETPSLSIKVTLRSWPGFGGVRWLWDRGEHVEKKRVWWFGVARKRLELKRHCGDGVCGEEKVRDGRYAARGNGVEERTRECRCIERTAAVDRDMVGVIGLLCRCEGE